MKPIAFMVLVTSCATGTATTPTCQVGETRACHCGVGPGVETCVTPEGGWSACGCASAKGPDVAVPPAPPPPTSCGAMSCTPYTMEDSEVGAKACCTTSGACGSSSTFLFGDACVARGGPVGTASTECPSESINFVDLEGCCRPDGQCGLSIDAVPNFDLGCVERTTMQKLLNDGSGQRDLLALVVFLPQRKASFPAKSCHP